MKKHLPLIAIAGIILVGCSSQSAISTPALEVLALPTVQPIAIPTLTPPTETNSEITNQLNSTLPEPSSPVVPTNFEDFPENHATGDDPVEFTANLLGGGRFSLSLHGGNYLLVFPTAFGCGDCVYGIAQIALANEAYFDSGLKILVLDLLPEDDPEIWQYFDDLYIHPNFSWGVVESDSFVVDYKILTLGTILLFSPNGEIVYRSDYPLDADQLDNLFSLTTL